MKNKRQNRFTYLHIAHNTDGIFNALLFLKLKKNFFEKTEPKHCHPKVTSYHLTLPHLTTVPTDKFKDSIHLGV